MFPRPPSGCPQGNVDPVVLFGSDAAVEAAVRDCLSKAGERGHVLNLGHGVLVGTPEVRGWSVGQAWAGSWGVPQARPIVLAFLGDGRPH